MKKIITMYLPQFHEIEENNQWWEPGFTEWTNLKRSKPLFKNHNQPRVPLNKNYYDLTDISVMKDQAELAKKYNVYGWCFYHYWFEGRQIMEKPVNRFLESDIDMNYCFSWANHTWTKAPGKRDEKILLKQTYGNKDDWEKHFKYLEPFFLDDRYIKVGNKPMLVIYDVLNIDCFLEMKECWDEMAKAIGFDGIHYVGTLKYAKDLRIADEGLVDAVFEYQPTFGLRREKKLDYGFWYHLKYTTIGLKYLKRVTKFNYDRCWRTIIRKSAVGLTDLPVYVGAFNDWDTTARWSHKGNVMVGATPEKFEKYLKIQCEKNDEEYVFLTAWNEWSEGAYIEPDEKNGYGYLEAVQKVVKGKSK